MRPPVEAKAEQRFVKEAKAIGCLCRKLNGSGNRDWPDQLCLVPGGAKLLFEFKREGKDLRPTQQAWHDKAADMDQVVYTVWGWAEALDIVEAHRCGRR